MRKILKEIYVVQTARDFVPIRKSAAFRAEKGGVLASSTILSSLQDLTG